MAVVPNIQEDPLGGDASTDQPLSQAIVDRIRDGLATVLVGPQEEEWAFPAHILPPEAVEGSVLILEGSGRNFRVIGIGAGRDGVQERLSRTLNQRRRIVFPLPHREIPVPVSDPAAQDRPSRLLRRLGHRP
jgi:hypothetical protein